MEQLRIDGKRVVLFANPRPINGHYYPSFVFENEAGYNPTDWDWGTDLQHFEKCVASFNAERGYTEADAAEVINSSLRASQRLHARCAPQLGDKMPKQMTRTEWRKTHTDYKSRIDGTPYVLDLVPGKGTCLVPVEIIPDPDEKPTIKAMRDKIANANALVCHDALLNPERTGTVYVIDKHQKNSLRTHVDGKAFWLSLDIIEPLDANTYAAIGTPKCPYPGEILGIYGIVDEAAA